MECLEVQRRPHQKDLTKEKRHAPRPKSRTSKLEAPKSGGKALYMVCAQEADTLSWQGTPLPMTPVMHCICGGDQLTHQPPGMLGPYYAPPVPPALPTPPITRLPLSASSMASRHFPVTCTGWATRTS